jgi:hypothetical protein
VEHDHYPHTMLEPMDRDPIAWKKSLEFERYLAEYGASKPWQIFKAASELVKEQKDDNDEGSDRDRGSNA